MIAALILVISIAAFLQFFLSYCRSLVVTYRKWELSDEARKVTGIHGQSVDPDEFGRLLELVRLCPVSGDDTTEIRSVRAYYGMLNVVRQSLRSLMPTVREWIERDRYRSSRQQSESARSVLP